MKVHLLPENAAYTDQLAKEIQLRNISPRTIKTCSNLLSKLAAYFKPVQDFAGRNLWWGMEVNEDQASTRREKTTGYCVN